MALIGEVPSSSAASSSDQPLAKTGFPSLLSSLKSEMNDSSDEDEDDGTTTNNAEKSDDHEDIATNKILQAIKESELRIIAEIRKTIQLTKVKTFVFEDEDNDSMTCNQTSSTDICFYIM